uniref:RRM domain-containing protein n=1 Tax=Clastoptera arizonana TaxID=38151 RepID=A0A1B6C775_9HEMI
MEVVKLFNSELSSLYEAKPPISKAKMTSITRTAIKAIKFYKHVVQSVEKFIQKCKPEYKVPGLYVIDSIVRQSRHQFGTEKDVFAPRFARNLQTTFIQLFNCPQEDKSKVIRVLNLWQKNNVFESDVIQPLFDLADPSHPIHKELPANTTSNGITSKPSTNTPKLLAGAKISSKDATAGWVNQTSHIETSSSQMTPVSTKHTPVSGQSSVIDVNFIQQLQQLQTLLDQRTDNPTPTKKDSDQVKFDKKLLDFDYDEEEEEDATAGTGVSSLSHSTPTLHHQQQQVASSLDSLGSILSNPEVLRQLQNLQVQLHQQQVRHESEEKLRKLQEMRQQEEEFDKHLAQTVPNLPFADECDFKPNQDLGSTMPLHHQAFMQHSQGLSFPGMDLSQPPPGYGMSLQKSVGSPLEDGEHANSDLDERIGMRKSEEGGGAVVIIDSESPSDSPAHRRRRRRSNSRSRHRSRSDSRSRSRSKRKRSRSYDRGHGKDYDRTKDREMEKERERDRRRKGLPPLQREHLSVCSTTLWIGHLSKLVQQEELSDTFGEYGDIVSINLIPPRGCAFICMNRRQDAHKALQQLRHHKLQGKAITIAWAPGKGMKDKEWKDYWEVEQGVSYIPWCKIPRDIDLELLEDGGMLDEESFPDWLIEKQRRCKEEDQIKSQGSSQTAEDDKPDIIGKMPDMEIPVPTTMPGFIPLPEGPQPNDIKTSSASIPTMIPATPTAMPPLGMMPPFGLHNVPRLLGPMGMAMSHAGLMSNVPLGVPPPLMATMHQQMMSRMPQPVGSPFNAGPGVGLLPHPQLSQIPLPTPQGQDGAKSRMNPLGVPPPTGDLSSFPESMLQLPFTLPPQLQLQASGLGVLPPRLSGLEQSTPMDVESDQNTNKDDDSASKSLNNSMANMPFNRPPPHFSPLTLLKIPPPLNIPPPNSSMDKDDRDIQDKDYRNVQENSNTSRDEKDKDYRSARGRDGDFRNKEARDKDGRDRDYRDRDRRDSRRDRDRNHDDKDSNFRNNKDSRNKEIEEGKENESKKDRGPRNDLNKREEDDRNFRDRSRNRDRDRDRDRDRGRDRGGRWNDRDREKDDRSKDRNTRDRDMPKNKDDQTENKDKLNNTSLQERLRNLAHDQNRPSGEFVRRGRSPPKDTIIPPLLPPPTVNMDPNDMPFHGPPRGPMFGGRANMGVSQDGHNRHSDEFGHRGQRGPRDNFDNRGPPRGPPDNFDVRGPPRGPPENFDGRGPPPLDNFNPRGPPPDVFDHRGPPADSFDPRGPPHEGFGPMEGFGPPRPGFKPQGSEDFHPRIRIEFFPRRGGMGHPPDNFMRMKGRGPMGPGPMFPPRGPPGPMGMRGPRPGMWMDGPGFPHRGFPPPDGPPPDEFFNRGPPVFDESGRGQGDANLRGRGRGGFQGRNAAGSERRREEGEGKRSRWSNASPSPPRQTHSPSNGETKENEISKTLEVENHPTSAVNDQIKDEEKYNLCTSDKIEPVVEKGLDCKTEQKSPSLVTEEQLPIFVKNEFISPQKRRLSQSDIKSESISPSQDTKKERRLSLSGAERSPLGTIHEVTSTTHEKNVLTKESDIFEPIIKIDNSGFKESPSSADDGHQNSNIFQPEKKVNMSKVESGLPDPERRLSFLEQEKEFNLIEQEARPEKHKFSESHSLVAPNERKAIEIEPFCDDFDIEPKHIDDQDFACASFSALPDDFLIPNKPSIIEDEFRIDKPDLTNYESKELFTETSNETDLGK